MHVVVNWLWQGVVLTIVVGAALRSARRASASTRYLLWWVAMILVLVLPVLPDLASMPSGPAVPASASPSIAPVPLPDIPAWPQVVALCVWAAWVVVSVLRLVLSTLALGDVRRRATPFPLARETRLTHWRSVRGKGRRARLAISNRVRSASVIGLGDVLIAVSPEAAGRLSDEELDQVVLHEWAHVQRRDDYARLAQVVVRCVAGIHPAVWWIGRKLEIERELACDDYAVAVTGAARSLAVSLTKLADLQQRPAAAALAPGVLRSSQLTVRVRRLLDQRRRTTTRPSHVLLATSAITMIVVAIAIARLELVAEALPIAAPAIRAPAIETLLPVAVAPSASPASQQTIEGPSRQSPTRPTTVPVTLAAQTPRAATGVAAAPPSSGHADKTIEDAPMERLGRAAWQVPSLRPLAGAGSGETVGIDASGEGQKSATPWGAAADAGISIGHGSQKAASATADASTSLGKGSQKAAVGTAGFFTRLSRKIAGSF